MRSCSCLCRDNRLIAGRGTGNSFCRGRGHYLRRHIHDAGNYGWATLVAPRTSLRRVHPFLGPSLCCRKKPGKQPVALAELGHGVRVWRGHRVALWTTRFFEKAACRTFRFASNRGACDVKLATGQGRSSNTKEVGRLITQRSLCSIRVAPRRAKEISRSNGRRNRVGRNYSSWPLSHRSGGYLPGPQLAPSDGGRSSHASHPDRTVPCP